MKQPVNFIKLETISDRDMTKMPKTKVPIWFKKSDFYFELCWLSVISIFDCISWNRQWTDRSFHYQETDVCGVILMI